jgi:hypothetical protein
MMLCGLGGPVQLRSRATADDANFGIGPLAGGSLVESHGDSHELRHVTDAHSRHDPCTMVLDRLGADMEFKPAAWYRSTISPIDLRGVLADGEVIDLGGGKRVRFIDTPHIPHGWDAGMLYEESTRTPNTRVSIPAWARPSATCPNSRRARWPSCTARRLRVTAPPPCVRSRMITTAALPVRCPKFFAARRPKSSRKLYLARSAGSLARLSLRPAVAQLILCGRRHHDPGCR